MKKQTEGIIITIIGILILVDGLLFGFPITLISSIIPPIYVLELGLLILFVGISFFIKGKIAKFYWIFVIIFMLLILYLFYIVSFSGI